jgi:hypothetical protein
VAGGAAIPEVLPWVSNPSRFLKSDGISKKEVVGGSPLLQQGELDFSPAKKPRPQERL